MERANISETVTEFERNLYYILEYYSDIIQAVSCETAAPTARPLDDALGFDLIRI